MMERMPSHVMNAWQAYFEMEPFGYRRRDISQATAAFGLARIMNARRGKRFGIEDFLANYQQTEQKSPEQIRSVLSAAVGAFKRVEKMTKRRRR